MRQKKNRSQNNTHFFLRHLYTSYFFGKYGTWKIHCFLRQFNFFIREITSCGARHLTSFATGFTPELTTIDFEFVFTESDFEDNLTVYLMVILVATAYFSWLCWAIWMDRRDKRRVPVPCLADNHPEDHYLYEMLVQTG